MHQQESPRVALLVETSTAWARSILSGVNRYLRKKEYWQLFLEPHGSNESIRIPKSWEGEGIIADIKDARMAAEMANSGIPVVNISQLQFRSHTFPTVTTDIHACLAMAVDYYAERGFEHLACLSLQGNTFDAKNSAHFGTLAKEAGRSFFSKEIKKRAWGVADWNLSIRSLADWLITLPKPIGIFSWAIGREVVHACHLARLRMPDDVSLLMLSDDDIFLEFSHIPMSGIIHPGEQIGHRAAQVLDQLMSKQGGKSRSQKATQKTLPERTQTELMKPLGVKTRQSSDVLAISDPALRMAIGFIRKHRSAALQVDEVVRHVGVSRRALEQRFAKTLGRSPADYIRDLHLERAKELLRETTLPIPEVSDMAGFSSPEYMAQLFRAKLSTTPLRFRKDVTAR